MFSMAVGLGPMELILVVVIGIVMLTVLSVAIYAAVTILSNSARMSCQNFRQCVVVCPSSRLLTKLRGHLQNVTLSIPEIVDDISDDPIATMELLRIANSTCAGSSRTVVSVHEAVVRLGIRQTIATVLIADQTHDKPLSESSGASGMTAATAYSQEDEFNAAVSNVPPVADVVGPGQVRSHRVLVIDDEAAIVKMADRMLSRAGFEVIGCSNPDDAPALSEGVDIVLCDVHLGNTTGMDVILRLRKPGVEAPVIMISGDRTRETVVDCIDAGIVDYIIKPFSRAVLIEKVTTHLAGTPSLVAEVVGR